jgi:hypothetical protein
VKMRAAKIGRDKHARFMDVTPRAVYVLCDRIIEKPTGKPRGSHQILPVRREVIPRESSARMGAVGPHDRSKMPLPKSLLVAIKIRNQ